MPTSTKLRGRAEVPKLEPQIEFSVGIFSHERRKHLNFTVRRSGAILPRNPHLEPFTSWCSFAASLAPPHPCSRRANLTIRTCFLAQGWRSTSNSSILVTRSSCLGAPGAPAVRSGWAGCCGRLSCWVVLARGEFSRDEFSTSDDDWAAPFYKRSRRALFDGTLARSRARCASRCVLERLSCGITEMWCVIEYIGYCSSVRVSLWFLSDLC